MAQKDREYKVKFYVEEHSPVYLMIYTIDN